MRAAERAVLLSRIWVGYGLLLATLLTLAAAAQADEAPSPPAVPLVRVRPDIVSIPVVRGADIRFRRLSLAQGLSQTRVGQIVQDDRGFVWFGTQHGANRFDGYGFRVFKQDPDRPDSLSGSYVYALFKDRSGTIWIGSDQGVDAFDASRESFRHYPLDTVDPAVNHISQDADGMIWLATAQGLYRLDPASGEPRRFTHDPADPLSLPSNDIKATGEDRTGTFWVASGEGLDAFDRATGRSTLRIPLRESVREFSFHEDRSGTFWIIHGSGNGLALYDRRRNEVVRYRFDSRDITGTSLTGVYAVLESHDGTIWLGTMGAGLLRYDRERHRFESYGNDPANPESLAGNRVIALAEDSEHNIWVGLHASPPNWFPSIAPPFESLKPAAAHANSLGESLVNAVFEDSRGNLWMGAGGALHRLNRAAGEQEIVEPLGPGVPIEVLTIAEHPEGVLWVGSLGNGLQSIDLATRQVRSFRHDPGDPTSISSDIVTRLLLDRAGGIWAATWNGLDRLDPGTGRFTTFKKDSAAPAEAYFSIAEDQVGALWLGSTAGLHRFEPATGRFTSFTRDPGHPASLSNNTVNTVAVDGTGTVWVGTQNGLNRYDPQRAAFEALYDQDGLPGSAVSCILADGAGNLWMSTNAGVARMRLADRTFESFSTADGLPGNDLTGWNACHRSGSGELFFAGFAGATALRPERLTQDKFVPPVAMTELRLAGVPVAASQPPLHGSITFTDAITLTPQQNDFSLGFSALSFSSPETNRYRYRLVGLDDRWHVAGSNGRLVGYTTLPAGHYRFEAEAATSRGAWASPGAGLDIVVLPPWWQTWWFRAFYIGAIGLLLLAAYRYRLRQIAWQYNLRLEERVSERTRIARELHDSLLQGFQGSIFLLQAARDLLPGSPERAMAQLDTALDRADAAIVEGRDAVRDLRDQPQAATDLVQSLTTLGSELSALDPKRRPTLKVLVEGRSRPLDAAIRDEVYRIAREALRNAFRHANARNVECELGFTDGGFSLRVRDDGDGIDPAVLEAGIRAGHWGLPGMRERAEELGGSLTVWSAKGAGTELELRIAARIAYDRRS